MESISNAAVEGHYVNLREVKIDDAEFILSLRCDEKKSKFLHKTEYDLKKQKEYIKSYFLKNEYYFISENKKGEPIGTIRIYDIFDKTFTIGSWIMVNETTPEQVIETEFLCRMYGFGILDLSLCKFDVRKENKKVVRYHKLTGSKIVGETDLDYFFVCAKDNYIKNIEKFIDLSFYKKTNNREIYKFFF